MNESNKFLRPTEVQNIRISLLFYSHEHLLVVKSRFVNYSILIIIVSPFQKMCKIVHMTETAQET